MSEETIADKLEGDVLEQIERGENAENPIKRIKKRIDTNDTQRGFSISRIPTDAHQDFKTLAENMFADDYGMTLAFLIRYFKMTDGNNRALETVSEDLHDRLDDIEEQLANESGSEKVSTLQ